MRPGIRAVAALGALFCAIFSPDAEAENASTVSGVGIATEFQLCVEAGRFEGCTDETWSISTNRNGWVLLAFTDFQGQRDRWSEQCRDGVYQSDAGGLAWTGICRLVGDESKLCFEADFAAGAEVKTLAIQCFALRPADCDMSFGSIATGLDPASGKVSDRAVITAAAVKSCSITRS